MTTIDGFDRRLEPFRSELLAYCYRMLGLAPRRRDLVQETYLRAWRAREQYDETLSSLRTWLYRIASNACLTALESRGRRPLPSGLVAASDPLGPLVPGENVAWLQPLPDSLLDAADPAGTVTDRSSLRLAFVAALQHLSARQRGALILRDVLDFSASEAADILGTSVGSVNSSLAAGTQPRERRRCAAAGSRRADGGRAARLGRALHAGVPGRRCRGTQAAAHGGRAHGDAADAELVRRTGQLRPVHGVGVRRGRNRLAPEDGHGQRAARFAAYRRVDDRYELHTLQLFTVTAAGISRNSVFQESEVFASFGLARTLDA